MRALAAAAIRLIRPFHFVQSPQNAARNGEQTALKDELDMIVTVLDPVNDSRNRLAGHHAFSVYFPKNFALLDIRSERCIIECCEHDRSASGLLLHRPDPRISSPYSGPDCLTCHSPPEKQTNNRF